MIRWPAEWEPQSAVMLTWPRRDGDFAADFPAVEACFRNLATAISRYSPLLISFSDKASLGAEKKRLKKAGGEFPIHLFEIPADDIWVRDHGPVGVLQDNAVHLLKFRFDGWGGLYPAQRDDALVGQLHEAGAFTDIPLRNIDLTLEGGAIETDGRGTLLATRRSVLDPRRNPDLSPMQIETLLHDALGLQHFLWLEHGGLAGDDTSGHIDTLARFVAEDHIVYQAPGGSDDPNGPELDAMAEELARLRDPVGQPYRLTALPACPPIIDETGRALPASYANFLLINNALLVPQYGQPTDELALSVLWHCFPFREILPIDCRPLIRQNGSLHCATMNLPA